MITPIRNFNYLQNSSIKQFNNKNNQNNQNVAFTGLSDSFKSSINEIKMKKILHSSEDVKKVLNINFDEVQELIKYSKKNKIREFLSGNRMVSCISSKDLQGVIMTEKEDGKQIRRTIFSPNKNSNWYSPFSKQNYSVYSIYDGIHQVQGKALKAEHLIEFPNGDKSSVCVLKNYSINKDGVEHCDELYEFTDGKLTKFKKDYTCNNDGNSTYKSAMSFEM